MTSNTLFFLVHFAINPLIVLVRSERKVSMDLQEWFSRRRSRRRMLQGLGTLAGAGLALEAGIFTLNKAHAFTVDDNATPNPINHVLIACQENRTFDDYFGYYPRAGKFGLPANYALPDGKGGTVTPHHNSFPISNNPSHSWQSIHSEWNKGAMDSFYTADGSTALGYYDGSDLPYYYALADNFTLCGSYFCSLLGPSTPNRLALISGTAGG